MALYFKFRSAKNFSSMPIPGKFISVGEFKDLIFESKIGRGKDFDLVITNAQTNEDYVDESALIPSNTSVLIRRLPGWPRKPIVLAPTPAEENNPPELQKKDDSAQDIKPSGFICDSTEWDDFFASDSNATSSTITEVDDEDSKIQALVNTPALEWQKDSGFDSCGMGRRMMGRNIPPEGYVCRRCKVAGHFIQHCPTNGDPNYDIKKVKPPRGIPKTMLVANPDGLYGLPDGKVAVLRPDEVAFEKEVEGMPSARRSVVDIPPELYCKICKKVMEYAVIASKCCFSSFCDQCIRNYVISNSMCLCGATDILADHLLPNFTLRNTINRIMESNNTNSVHNNDKSASQIRHINPQIKVPSPVQSVASHKEAKLPSPVQSLASDKEAKVPSPSQSVASNTVEVAVVSEKEDAAADEASEIAKTEEGEPEKRKRKKAHAPSDDEQKQWNYWSDAQNLAAKNYMMSMAFAAYNPYWTWAASIQPGPYAGVPYAGVAPYMMNSGVGPQYMFSGGVLPQKQCSKEEFEARKGVPKRKR